jgi:hypothetical protein
VRDVDPLVLLCGFCCVGPVLLFLAGWVTRGIVQSYKLSLRSPIVADRGVGKPLMKEEERARIRAIVARSKQPEDKIGYGP